MPSTTSCSGDECDALHDEEALLQTQHHDAKKTVSGTTQKVSSASISALKLEISKTPMASLGDVEEIQARKATAKAKTTPAAGGFTQVQDECDFINIDTGKKAQVGGYAPSGPGKFPLAVYLQGTTMSFGHAGSTDLLEEMAQRGFVAVNIQYSNMGYFGSNCTKLKNKAENVAECITKICQQNNYGVDCGKGVAAYGYSQGGQIANFLGNYKDKVTGLQSVTAVLGISSTILSYGGITAAQKECLQLDLSRSKRRILIGDEDGQFGGNGTQSSGQADVVIANALYLSGYDDGTCTGATYDCIQPDGSGYFVATTEDTGIPHVNHHWIFKYGYDRRTRKVAVKSMSPTFANAPEDKKWGAKNNFDWLSHAATSGAA